MSGSATNLTNHMIIGLGGTGGHAIRAFRKEIVHHCDSKEPPEGVNVGYLYVDSDNSEMDRSDPRFRVLGQNVQLAEGSRLDIEGQDVGRRIGHLEDFANLRGWAGDKRQWEGMVAGHTKVLGGQRRRLGRLLFACKAAEFVAQVTLNVKQLQEKGDRDARVAFHIIAGLAGGTGSGAVVDAVALLRHKYDVPDSFPITVYAVLPEKDTVWDTGYYHANGYAALVELNALGVQQYHPHNLAGDGKPIQNLEQPVFNTCYLFERINEAHRILNINEEPDSEVSKVLASFLYTKIVTARDRNWVQLRRFEKAENVDATAECANVRNENRPERCRTFGAFGIKSLRVPATEIQERLQYSFTLSAIRQLQFNRWVDNVGYLDEPDMASPGENFGDPHSDLLDRWRLSIRRLTLAEPILKDEEERKWKDYQKEWGDLSTRYLQAVQQNYSPPEWLPQIQKLFHDRFESQFRSMGVKTFYSTKERDRKAHVREIVSRVQSTLLDEILQGRTSFYEANERLKELVGHLEGRLRAIDEARVKADETEKSMHGRAKENYHRWGRMGLLERAIGGRSKLLTSHSATLADRYKYATHKTALEFAGGLLAAVIAEIQTLQSEVSRCFTLLAEKADESRDQILVRCSEQDVVDLQKPIVKFYDRDAILSVTTEFERDEEVQQEQTKRARDQLSEFLSESRSFRELSELISEVPTKLEKQALRSVRAAHERFKLDNRGQDILHGNVFQELQQRFGNDDEKLQSFVSQFVREASLYVNGFNDDEVKRDPPKDAQQKMVRGLTVFLPTSEEYSDYRARVKRCFERESAIEVCIEDSDDSGELTVVSLANMILARYLKTTKLLRSKYDARNAQDSRMRFAVHSEGDGNQFPSLFLPTREDVRNQALPFLIVASAMDRLTQTKNNLGRAVLRVTVPGGVGALDDHVDFAGSTLLDAQEDVDVEKLFLLEGEMNRALAEPQMEHVDNQEALVGKLKEVVEVALEHLAKDHSRKATDRAQIEEALRKSFLTAKQRVETTGS
jgi:hypothetical protein